MPKLNLQNIKGLLDAFGLKLDYYAEERDGYDEPAIIFRLTDANNVIGTCMFYRTNNQAFHIEDIEIFDDARKSQGLGTILMYATLCYIEQQPQVTHCTLACFPNNYSFYVRNGFYFCFDNTTDKNWWYQLTVDEKKDLLFQQNNFEKNKKLFFQDDNSLLENTTFDFTNVHAIRLIQTNIAELNYRYRYETAANPLIHAIVSKFPAEERLEVTAFFQSRMSFFQNLKHLENGPGLFVQELQQHFSNSRS